MSYVDRNTNILIKHIELRNSLFLNPNEKQLEQDLQFVQNEFKSLSTYIQNDLTYLTYGPTEIVLEISGKCNLKCMMCVGVSGNSVSKKISVPFDVLPQDIIKFIERCDDNLESVYISGISEPLLATSFEQVCQHIDRLGKKIAFLTNGTLLDKSKQDFLASLGKLSVGVSFDGVKPSTFERIRHGANYDQVVGNIKGLVAALGCKNRTSIFIGLNFCAMRFNIDELPELVKQSVDWGIDNFSVHHLMPWTVNMVDESLFFEQSRFDDIVLQAEENAHIAGISFSRPALFQDRKSIKCVPWKRCRHPWNVLQIQRFKIATCCSYVLQENPEAGKYTSYGEIYPDQELNHFWNGEAIRKLRRDLLAGTPSDHCLNCTNYPYDERITPEKLLPHENMHCNPVAEYFMMKAKERGLA